MTPEEIISAYDVLVEDVRNHTAQEAAKIGNSQRSLGLMAERAASPTGQTSGLANYTYNRTMRPVIDSTAAKLQTTGTAQALEKKLMDDLLAAKNNYENARNRAASTPSSGGGQTLADRQKDYDGREEVHKNINVDANMIIGTGYNSGGGGWFVNVSDGNGGSNIRYLRNSIPGRVVGSGWNNGTFVLNILGNDGKARLVPVGNDIKGMTDYE